MATRSLGILTLDVVAKIGGFQQGMTAAERASDRAARNIANRQKQAAQQVEQAWGNAMKFVGGALTVRAVMQAADGYSLLSARLKLVSKDAQEYALAQAEVVRIANDSRVSLEDTANLYTQISRTTQGLGFSQKELLGVTESINQALLVSGGSAESAKAALTQLSQAFASGVLRGEEFNSVSEQAPRILQAIAAGIGVNIGKLREMAKDGELTAERVIKAIQSQAAVLEAEAKGIPLTIGQATTQATNALMLFIGAVDTSTGSTAGLSKALSETAGFFNDLALEIQKANSGVADVGFLAQAFTVASQTVRILGADVAFVFKGIYREVVTVAKQLIELPDALLTADFSKFRGISDAARADAERARAELDKYQFQVLNPFLNSKGRGTTGGPDPRLVGTTPANETVGFRPTRSSDPEKEKKARRETLSDAERYFESLRKQLQATENLSVAETVLRDIQAGRVKLSSGVTQEQLLDVAKQIDLARERIKTEDELRKAMEATAEMQKRADDAAIDEVQKLVDSNQALRDEIELIGLEGEARAKIEMARVSATIALKEEALAMAQNAGASETVVKSLEREIVLLKQRLGLLKDKGTREADAKAVEEMMKRQEQAYKNIQDALGQGLYDIATGNFRNIGQAFTQMLTRMAAEAVAADLMNSLFGRANDKGQRGGGVLSDLFQGVMSFFAPGRANGGGVMAGGLYEINERSPEVLAMGGRQYLMMGNQGGAVIPNAGGGRSIVNNISVNMPQGATRQTAMQFGAEIGRQLEIARSRNG